MYRLDSLFVFFLQSSQVNGLADPLSDLSVSGSTAVVNKSSEGNFNDSGKIPHKKGPIIDMRAMLNNAIKGATQQYMGDGGDPSVSVWQNDRP